MSKLSLVVLAVATLAILPGCLGMNSSNTTTGTVMTGTEMNTGTEVVIETPVVMTGTETVVMTGTETVVMTGTETVTGTEMNTMN